MFNFLYSQTLAQKANWLLRHDFALANPCSFQSPTSPCTQKHIPKGLAPWFFQGVQWNWAAQAFLDYPFDRWVQYLPPIAVAYRWENSPKKVSVSFLSILGCCTSAWRDCMGLELPVLLLSSLNPSSVQIYFTHNIPHSPGPRLWILPL